MKRWGMIISMFLIIGLVIGCGSRAPRLKTSADLSGGMAVLSSRGDLNGLSDHQITARNNVGHYMDRYLIAGLNRQGFNSHLINDKNDWNRAGYLLQVTIVSHKEVPKSARFWGGRLAGADTLNLHYDLLDSSGSNVLSWDDGVGSTNSSNHCAQTLNRRAINKITQFFNTK